MPSLLERWSRRRRAAQLQPAPVLPTPAPKVAVFGASGFAGALAARLIDAHPRFQLAAVTSRSDAGKKLSELYPQYRVELTLELPDFEKHAAVDAAVVAYPHGASAELVKQLREKGVRVIDLSADFRLNELEVYEEWYVPHPAPELIGGAVYGLPEFYREQIKSADLVACPGCFPTGALLALAPLAKAGLIADAVIDAKTGVSGSGREATQATHFVTVDENVNAYKVPRHRHTPEIEQELKLMGSDVRVTFTPHLVPLDQGELVSCYVTLTDPTIATALIEQLYHDAYRNEQFVEVVTEPPGVRAVRDSNFARISVHRDDRTGRVIAFGAIDNLWKGTASQAVQNLNLMFGYPEAEGIK